MELTIKRKTRDDIRIIGGHELLEIETDCDYIYETITKDEAKELHEFLGEWLNADK